MNPKLLQKVWVSGALGGKPLLPFSDNFSSVFNPRWLGSNTWAVSNNAAVNTPGLSAPIEINGAFADNTGWTAGAGWSVAGGVAAGNSASSILYHAGITAKTWYQVAVDLVTNTAGYIYGYLGGANLLGHNVAGATYTETGLSGAGGNIGETGVGFSGTIDNLIVKSITHANMFKVVEANRPDVDVSVNFSASDAGHHGGLVLCLDNPNNPSNFIIVYIDRVNIYVAKCVAGVYTVLSTTGITYAATGAIRATVTKSGSNILVDVFYNGIGKGAQQTISDAGIVSNTKHGIFSTSPAVSLDSFTLAPR